MPKPKIVVTALLLVVASVLWLSCASQAVPAAGTASQVVTVERGNIRINITAAGNLTTAREAKLTFGSSGKVQGVLVGLGDYVPTGAVLAKLETLPLERSLIQAQLNVKSAQMNLENAKEPRTNTSGTTVLSAPDPLNIEIKEFQLQTARLDLKEAELKLKNATMTAPFAGLIAEVNVVAGDQAGENTVIVRLIDQTKFKVTVLVNEAEINRVAVGANASVQVEAVRSIVFPAKVAHISPVATIQSNVVNYKVEVEFSTEETSTARQTGEAGQITPQAGQRQQRSQQRQASTVIPEGFQLREGQTVIANILIDEVTNVVLVPNRAIISRSGKSYVQVVTSATVNEERVVQTGISDGQYTQITSGLNEGEQLAVVQTATTTTTPTTQQQQRQQQQPSGGIIPGMNRLLK